MAAEPSREATLEESLEAMIAAGCGMEDLESVLAAAGVYEAEPEAPQAAHDDLGRPTLPDDSERGYFNIRDKSEGDAQRAADLAEWCARKHKKAEGHIAEVMAHADAQVTQIRDWQKRQTKKSEAELAFFAGVLDLYQSDFHRGQQKVSLVNGTLRLKKNRTLIAWDEEAALAWAIEQPTCDDLAPRKLSKSSVKSLLDKRGMEYVLQDTGEVVPFVTETEPPMAFEFVVEH